MPSGRRTAAGGDIWECCMQLQNPAQPNRLPQRPRRLPRPSQQAPPCLRYYPQGKGNPPPRRNFAQIIAGAARNTCHLCVFIGIRPRKYLVQSTVPAAGVKAHRSPVITVLPGDFSRVAGVLCQLHSIIHTRTGRRVDQPRHKIKAGVRFPGYRIHNKNMLHQGIPLSSHFIIIIPHLYQTYNCHSVQKSGR